MNSESFPSRLSDLRLALQPLLWCLCLTVMLAVSGFLPAGAFFTDPQTYLPFHTVLELIAILISFMVFILSWNLRNQLPDGQLLVIGFAFLIVGFVDFAHSVSFLGMPAFVTPSGTEKAINFWLVGRAVAAVALFTVAIARPPRLSPASCYAALAGALLFSLATFWLGIAHPDWWPRTFIAGQGLTPFKINSEYAIALVYGVSAVLLGRRAVNTRNEDMAWLAAAAWVLGLAELFFTLYSRVTDLYNFLGHAYKFIAYFMIYRALFVAGVRAPYQLLSLERARLRSIVNTIPDLVWVKDTRGVYLFCNRTFEKLFGAPESQIIGKTDYDFVDRSLADLFRENDQKAIRHGGPCKNEESLKFKTGSYTGMFETTKTPIYDDTGTVIGVLGITHDITEAKRIQAELSQAREHLEEQVSQRTAQLREAKEAAEAAALAKANFLANMSHEIRTPMNAVLGMAHLALAADPPPKVRDYLRKIMLSGQHLLGIINDILDFSKIDAGKMDIEKVEFDLETVFQSAMGMISERCSQKGIELVLDMPSNVPRRLVGDPLRTEQALVNYLNNAVKFTDRGEIILRVRLEDRRTEEITLRFEVHDTGVGIDSQKRAQLFQAFQQVDSSTTRKYGGTGLGLAITKRLAEAMGGEVGVESELGAGSTFWFSARFSVATSASEESPIGKAAGLCRVLVVDDNLHARESAAGMLQSMGFLSRAMASGLDALAEISRAAGAGEPYDVLVVDWKMPHMDGIALAQKAKELSLEPPPRIIMLTANDENELRAAASGLNISAVLPKPLTMSRLFDGLSQALGYSPPENAKQGREGAGPKVLAQAIQGARALVVEDNELSQEVAVGILKELGLQADVACNGAEAIDMIARQKYDVVLMDVQMPVMDGITATQRMRQDHRYDDLPIIAMTASVMQSDRDKCLVAGMNDHVSKPIEPGDLLNKLLRWVVPVPEGLSPSAGVIAVDKGATTGVEIPAEIPGLDTAQGLRRVLDNKVLYLSLLSKFASGQRSAADQIGGAMTAGDWALAERLAHSLKSVSGSIGAAQIADVSATLEAALRERRSMSEIDSLLAELKARVVEMTDALSTALLVEAPRMDTEVDQVDLEAVCTRMAALLSQSDAEASEVLRNKSALLAAAFPKDYSKLKAEVDAFDFEAALSTLKQAWKEQSSDVANRTEKPAHSKE